MTPKGSILVASFILLLSAGLFQANASDPLRQRNPREVLALRAGSPSAKLALLESVLARYRSGGASLPRYSPRGTILVQDNCIQANQTCTLYGTPCCAGLTCQGSFPNTTCQTPNSNSRR